MGFAGRAAQNTTPAVIHSATIRSGLKDACASHWRYGAQLLRAAGSVQHFFVVAVPGLIAFSFLCF